MGCLASRQEGCPYTMSHRSLSVIFLAVCGCGTVPTAGPACPDREDCFNPPLEADPAERLGDSPAVMTVPVPAPVSPPSAGQEPSSGLAVNTDTFELSPLDPFLLGLPPLPGVDGSDLIALFLDELLLDLLAPSGSGGSLTFLERLCRRTGEPDFVCRQRYGN